MLSRVAVAASLFLLASPLPINAQVPPPGDNKPLLRLEAGGPTSNVTALAFSPDGQALYAAGFDKVVRVWARNPKTGKFELDDKRYFRVPINPGTEGAINAMALSSDGDWLAVGGMGVVRVAAGFFDSGRLWPTAGLKPELRYDQGLIYLFSTRGPDVKMLRGHSGPVVALAFAPRHAKKPPLLLSAAQGWDFAKSAKAGEVRVWDTAKGESLGEVAGLPPPLVESRAPGLAAVHTGDALKDLRVIIAWGDKHQASGGKSQGYLRTWDVSDPQAKLQRTGDGYYNTALAQRMDDTSMISGSFSMPAGQIQLWDLTTNPPTVTSQAALAAPAKSYDFPDALALLAAQEKGPANHAAVLIRRLLPGGAQENRLRLINLSAQSFGQTVAQVPLWRDSPLGAVLAATPGGRHLAVAGNPDHSILVYAIDDLLRGDAQPQVLRSVGATMRHVVFAQRQFKDKAVLGLALNENPRPAGQGVLGDDLIFDFEERGFAGKVPAGWAAAAPAQGAWRVSNTTRNGRNVIRVLDGNRLSSEVTLPEDQRLDAVALLPPRAPLKAPMLVVAAYVVKNGFTILDVYHGATGKLCRRYTGHTAPITALAIAPDGRLLASAANDQTVSVWSLADLPDIVGRHGGLSGVSVVQRDKELVVAKIDDDSAARNVLAEDMVVEGIVAGGKVKPLASTREFYETFWTAKPGDEITLRVRSGNQGRDVAVTADQGIDEQKPLFALFVTRPGATGKREWLGWNAVGPFDSSGPAVESYVGWHFNTGKAEEPTKFAVLKQYRDEFYKRDILKHLVAEASLPRALEKQKLPPPPRPNPKIGDPLGAVKAPNGDILARNRQMSLQLAIQDFEPEPGDVVEYQLNDGPPQPLDSPEGNLWTIRLPELPAEGKRHRVRLKVQVQERGKAPVDYAQEWTVRFQPPAPIVTSAKNSSYDVAMAAEYAFEAKLHTPGVGPGCKVSLWLNDAKQPTATWDVPRGADPQAITKKLALREGNNFIKVVAENEPALAGFEEQERSVLTVNVAYKPGAPSVVFDKIEPLDGDEPGVKFEPGQRVVVNVPRVRLLGEIRAGANLTAAAWDRGEKSERANLLDFQPGKAKVPFAQEITLQPGVQTVRVLAKTAESQEGVETVTLLYRPQLPRLVLDAPEPVLREDGDKDSKEISLAGKLLPPEAPSPAKYGLRATIVHNGKALTPALELDSTAAALPARNIALTPGLNQIKVVLSHAEDWQGNPEEDSIQVRYVRPPRIVKMHANLVGVNPFVDVFAEVHSTTPLLAETIKVMVNDRPANYAKAGIKASADDPTGRTWNVEVKDVPLVLAKDQDVHANQVVLLVSNVEEQAAPSQPLAVTYKAPPPPRPEITLVSPGSTSALLTEPEVSLVFQVHSKKPLKRVEVTVGEKVFRPTKTTEKTPGVYEFTTSGLPLTWGTNNVKVEAINDGGPQETLLTLTVPPRPVELSLDLLRTEGFKAKTFKPQTASNGSRSFASVPDGRVVLQGKVRWSSQDDELLKKNHDVRIYVNGYQQAPVKLGPIAPDKPWERPFEARLILNLPENTVEVDLPSLKQQANSRAKSEVACSNHVRGQHLHIVLVAPGMKEDKDLSDRMAEALRAAKIGPNLYKSGVYDVIHMHKLTGYVPYYDVDSRLHNIGMLLRERAAQGSPNDVVMVHYLGQETVNPRGRYLWTSETRQSPRGPTKALALNDLVANHFSRFAGAQALFLDVSPESGSAAGSALEKELRLAMIQHTQPQGSPQPQLLQAVQTSTPSAANLGQLVQRLEEAGLSQLVLNIPLELRKLPLNPAAAGPQR